MNTQIKPSIKNVKPGTEIQITTPTTPKGSKVKTVATTSWVVTRVRARKSVDMVAMGHGWETLNKVKFSRLKKLYKKGQAFVAGHVVSFAIMAEAEAGTAS